jgi:hypothetical protein
VGVEIPKRSLISRARAGALPLGLRETTDLDWRKNQEGTCGYCWEWKPWWHALIECEGTKRLRKRYLRDRKWEAKEFRYSDLMRETRGVDRDKLRRLATWFLEVKIKTDEWRMEADQAWEREGEERREKR